MSKVKMFASVLLITSTCFAQQPEPKSLPDSPPQPSAAQASSTSGHRLTLAAAEKMAFAHNPNISIAHLLQLAQSQVTREARAGELPDANADLTAAGAHDYSRLTAGALNNSVVYNRAAAGLTVRQLITDFGRTHSLVRNAESTAKTQLETERATVEDIMLAVDQAFYQALTAQQVLRVAQQTVATRQATGEQIGALTNQKLRSTLDLSLANVQISQTQLLVLDAQNSTQAAMANLNAILGSEAELVDETPHDPQLAPANADDLAALELPDCSGDSPLPDWAVKRAMQNVGDATHVVSKGIGDSQLRNSRGYGNTPRAISTSPEFAVTLPMRLFG